MITYSTMWKILSFVLLLIIVGLTFTFIYCHPDFVNQFQVNSAVNRMFGLLLLSNIITLVCLFMSIFNDIIIKE